MSWFTSIDTARATGHVHQPGQQKADSWGPATSTLGASTGGASVTGAPIPTQPGGYETGQFAGGGKYPLASVQGPGLMAPFAAGFQKPTGTDDPGYAWRAQQGQQDLERSAAAKGTLLTGGTLKDLAGYSQGLASQEYQNAYQRAWQEYMGAFDIYNSNRQFQFGSLSNLAGMGQSAASGYGNVANQNTQAAANARAAGQAAASQAYGNAASGLAEGALGSYQASQQLHPQVTPVGPSGINWNQPPPAPIDHWDTTNNVGSGGWA